MNIFYEIIKKLPNNWKVKLSNTPLGIFFMKFLKARKKVVDIGNGVKIFLDLTNPRLLHLAYDEDIEEGKIKQTFLDLINVGDTVIDVGANIGEYSLIAAHKVKQNGRIIAIEPLKETVHSLTKNFQLNNFSLLY